MSAPADMPVQFTPEVPPVDASAGFSLLEVIAALVIAAVAAQIAIAAFNRPSGRSALYIMAIETAQLARAARSSAIAGGEGRLVVDLAGRTIRADSGRPLTVPADVTLAVTAARSERLTASDGAIRFFPNGSSTGGLVRLARGDVAYEVRVNWFTGRVFIMQP